MAQNQINRLAGSSSGHQFQSSGYRQGSYAPSVASSGYPINYPGAPQHGVMNLQKSGNYGQPGGGTVVRSYSKTSLGRQSRSLGASKASLASQRGKTSIQREYHDKKVRSNIQSPFFGKGRTPCAISIALIVLAGALVLAGITVLLLNFHGNIMLTVDKGAIIGPVLIGLGIASLAGGIKFCYDAYVISDAERKKIKFTAATESLIGAKTTTSSKALASVPGDRLMSGTASANAVSRTPHGSQASLANV